MHGTRTARINAILGKREAPAQQLKQTAERLEACRQEVTDLEQLRRQLATDAPTDVSQRLECLRLGEFDGRLASLAAEVRRLHTRFGRETLNIGVIGQAGQGKSSLLKALTGLGEEEIPTSGSKHCTGVACSFVNRDGAVKGEVIFHDEDSFLREVIVPYYSRDKGVDLGPAPASLEAFKARPLPALPESRRNNARDQTCYDHLRQYRTYLDGYRGWLIDTHRSRQIGRDEIRRFVAQVDKGDRPLLDWMAVREARISCPFPAKNVGPITFADTPGLGNTGIGDMERIFCTLRDRVDFVLFVRLPKGIDRGWQPLDLEL